MSEATQMINPPTEQTKMVQPPKEKKSTVRVMCLRPFKIEKITQDAQGKILRDDSVMAEPGKIYEVTREMARDLVKPLKSGSYAFSGERYEADKDIPRHDLTRARLATQEDLVVQKSTPLDSLDENDGLDAAI